jgi:small-conductance mechanosensitive channel
MPDAQTDSDWPILDWLGQVWPQSAGWIEVHAQQASLSNLWPQLFAVAAALLVARLLSRRLAPHTQRFVEARGAERQPLLTRLQPLLFPMLWMLLLWFAVVAMREADAPVKVAQIALGLIAAWAGVHIAASFVASPFWSPVLAVGIVMIVALKAFGLWAETLAILNQMALTVGSVRVSALGLIEAALILTVFWWAAGFGARRLTLWADRLPGLSPSERVLLGKLVRVSAWSLAVILALHAVGIDLTTLAVFSGAVGLGIGFGLQKVCSNLISGVILLLDRSVKPGDVISVGDHYGWINALGARYVSVVTRAGIEHLIPNEDLISGRVENWSHSNNLVRLHAPIGVAYSADLDRAMALAVQAAEEATRVLAEPPARCLLIGFGDSTVNLDLRFWINDPRAGTSNVISDVLKRVWDLYRDHGIDLPFPQRDLHLKSAEQLNVRVIRTP